MWLVRPPYRIHELVRQIDFIGVQSTALITVTGLFTGMVLTLQAHIAMSKYGAEYLIGAGVALSLCRELGPVLSALMVMGRAGSAMTAELGAMRTTEQIDALAGMAVEPIQYLVTPRIVAAGIVLPLLTIVFEFAGMLGAYLTVTQQLGLEGGTFISSVKDYLTMDDVTHGLIKSIFFGLILALVSCLNGYFVTGGARGVGQATTRAVIISSFLILASDYFMTTLMFKSAS